MRSEWNMVEGQAGRALWLKSVQKNRIYQIRFCFPTFPNPINQKAQSGLWGGSVWLSPANGLWTEVICILSGSKHQKIAQECQAISFFRWQSQMVRVDWITELQNEDGCPHESCRLAVDFKRKTNLCVIKS